MDELAEALRKARPRRQNKIRSLKADLHVMEATRLATLRYDGSYHLLPPYQGELGIKSYPHELREVALWMKELTGDICDRIMSDFYATEVTFENLENERELYEQGKAMLVARYSARATERAINELVELVEPDEIEIDTILSDQMRQYARTRGYTLVPGHDPLRGSYRKTVRREGDDDDDAKGRVGAAVGPVLAA